MDADRWLYELKLAIDANFRLKLKDRKCKDRLHFGDGWAYGVRSSPYKDFLGRCLDQVEVVAVSYPILNQLADIVVYRSTCATRIYMRWTTPTNVGLQV